MADIKFWKGKRVYITGHTGFKGGWLSLWLMEMGAIVKGYGLKPNTNPSLYDLARVYLGMESEFGDVRDFEKLKCSIQKFSPEVVFHLAAQPLVRESYDIPLFTYETNVIGTANTLEAIRETPTVKSVVVVTTDKCYENKEWDWGYRENERLGGHDPYSSSKACAEIITATYRKSYFHQTKTAVATARAGNVIGGGDWSSDRLIPDILKSHNSKQKIVIRNPQAVRPWQHVFEPLNGYLILAEELYTSGQKVADSFNFGPEHSDCLTVENVVNRLTERLENCIGWDSELSNGPHEANLLKLDTAKAKKQLGWAPLWELDTAIETIVDWNKSFQQGLDMREVCLNQINEFQCRLSKVFGQRN